MNLLLTATEFDDGFTKFAIGIVVIILMFALIYRP